MALNYYYQKIKIKIKIKTKTKTKIKLKLKLIFKSFLFFVDQTDDKKIF